MVDHAYQELAERFGALRARLDQSIIGQPEAIDAIIGALERFQAGLHDEKRPLGTFLFIGPSGSGKSFTVETMSRLLFQEDEKGLIPAFIRLDCSEFALEQDIAKIFGAAPGYIGSDNPSFLTKQYMAIPNKEHGFILLLDEIEKASRKFFDTWLQVLDAGRLTDSKGNVLDFTRALIFMTSNVGAEHHISRADIGFRTVADRETRNRTIGQVNAALAKTFKPEFLNRVSQIVHFSPLTREQQFKVLGNMISDLNTRLGAHYIRIEPTEKLLEAVLAKGYSKEYGARELKRALVKIVEQPLARLIIKREIEEDSLVDLDISDKHELVTNRSGDYPLLAEENVSQY